MTNLDELKLGDKITFSICYPQKARKRIEYNSPCDSKGCYNQTGLNSVFVKPEKRIGFIVGFRYAIMENAKFNPGHTDYEGDYRPGYLRGIKEKCLLVSYNPWRQLVLVRYKDLIF